MLRVAVDDKVCVRRYGVHADRAAYDFARDSREKLLRERDDIVFLTWMHVPVEAVRVSRGAAIVPGDFQARLVIHRKSVDFSERAVADINRHAFWLEQ